MPKINIIAYTILAVMFVLMLGSVWNDSATMDELAHIPSGYSYISQFDYRLNPEHPPLLKALSGLSARIFANPYFPTDTQYWNDDINGQWAQGAKFIYESGNDADRLIFWSRLPIILLALLFGWMLFNWTKKLFGANTAILALAFFAFSPTVIAHSRYVTTDLGAAFGFFIGLVYFIEFLENPTGRNLVIAGFAFGIAQLLKFSLVLLMPMYVAMIFFWIATRPDMNLRQRIKSGMRLCVKSFAMGLIGLLLIYLVYAVFIFNYPQERQLKDAEFLLGSYGFKPAKNLDLWLMKNEITRPLGQYVLGVLMVNQRAVGGNTAYFLGEVSGTGSRLYFPLLYLLKETLALHILTLTALWFWFTKLKKQDGVIFLRPLRENFKRVADWIHGNFAEFTALLFIAFYWTISVKSNLNIGVRHVLPTFPFIYMLVAKQITAWFHWHEPASPETWLGWLKNIYEIYIKSVPKYIFVILILLWMITSTVFSFPNYLSYYNALAEGSRNGYKIAVDSNYDWGQDLKRLVQYVEKQKIEKIAVDYFGGGSPRYYLGDKFEPWWSARGPASGWLAVSATFRQGAFGQTAPGFFRKPEDSYDWLKKYPPSAQIGHSIFLYKLP